MVAIARVMGTTTARMAIQVADKVYLNGSEQTVSAPVVQEVNRLLYEFD